MARKQGSGRPPKHRDIRIGDRVYATAKEAAEAENCCISTICLRARTGDTRPIRDVSPIPVRVGNRDYESISLAGRALGMSPSSVSRAIADGRADTVGQTPARRAGPRKAVDLFDTKWPSIVTCARDLNVSVKRISKAVNGKLGPRGMAALERRVALYNEGYDV